jgi:hypothetical protein
MRKTRVRIEANEKRKRAPFVARRGRTEAYTITHNRHVERKESHKRAELSQIDDREERMFNPDLYSEHEGRKHISLLFESLFIRNFFDVRIRRFLHGMVA